MLSLSALSPSSLDSLIYSATLKSTGFFIIACLLVASLTVFYITVHPLAELLLFYYREADFSIAFLRRTSFLIRLVFYVASNNPAYKFCGGNFGQKFSFNGIAYFFLPSIFQSDIPPGIVHSVQAPARACANSPADWRAYGLQPVQTAL